MFKALLVSYQNLPPDVDRDALRDDMADNGLEIDEHYDDFMVIQENGRTISCRPESGMSTGYSMTTDLMELAYYMGAVAGIKHEQGFMGGKSLKVLDEVIE